MASVNRSKSLLTQVKETTAGETQHGDSSGEQLKRHQSLPPMALEASLDTFEILSPLSSPDMFDDSDQETSIQILSAKSSTVSSSQESESDISSDDGIVIDVAYLR